MENKENQPENNVADGVELDDSLTNINWLGRFSSCGITSKRKTATTSKNKTVKPPRSPSVKRPPYSYSDLIKLAISSSPEKCLPLQQIYSWVEEHFPYYKYYANPGWKNSIRHSLSVQDIFVRHIEGSRRNAYWTIKSTSEDKRSCFQEKDHLNEAASGQIGYVSALPVMINMNAGGSSAPAQNKVGGLKKVQPLLPRGIAPCLIPVPVFVNPSAICTPSLSFTTSQSDHSSKVKRNIAPKPAIPLNVPMADSSVECHKNKPTERVQSGPESIITKRWKKDSGDVPRKKRKEKHQTLKEPEYHLHEDIFISNESEQQFVKEQTLALKTSEEALNLSPFKTPTKNRLNGVVTSTPCRESEWLNGSVLINSLKSTTTPPESEDSLLDSSLFKSPSSNSLGYTSLGLASLGNSVRTNSGYEHSEKDLPEFSLLSFTPVKKQMHSERLGIITQNDSLTKVFEDFTLPEIEEGTNLANISWSAFSSEAT
ncbi:forkhead box protein M1-like [Polypterus senegalus]|uniref:forkhead box protein M1-like n=1 Tax=Polypterus senegalus TaxID=55291 RepID=UPI001963162C|nr:forkhead box protein M1-like [Polypterus senegalus]